MLLCLTKSKIDCSFQNNEFRFKNRGFTQFFFFGFLFFFHFFGLHWMKLRNGMLKIMGGFFKRRGKKEEKTQFLWKKEKNLKKKKARTGFEPAIFGCHGNHRVALRDRRLTTWPPSRSFILGEKLHTLNLVPKMLTNII